MFSLRAETPIHVGIGQVGGSVDLPVARDGITQHPVVPGSGIKGAMRARFADEPDSFVNVIFGPDVENKAGAVLFGEARLLLLPIRSLNAACLWATCPLALERFQRDTDRALGSLLPLPDFHQREALESGKVLTLVDREKLFLEQWTYETTTLDQDDATALVNAFLSPLPNDAPVEARKKMLRERLVIMEDGEFQWFARNGLPVDAHNRLAPRTKESKALWYEETLPTDALLYTLLIRRHAAPTNGEDHVGDFIEKLAEIGYLQVGGNETVGQGWFRVTRFEMATTGGGGNGKQS